MTEASEKGMLSERGKPEQFKGAYAEVIQGVNAMLDAILIPIGEGNRVLAQVSNGKIDELITQTYKGDHEAMKKNINDIALVLQKFQGEIGGLIAATKDGKLNTRGNADQYEGAYGAVIKGINDLVDTFVTPLKVTADHIDRITKGNIPLKITEDYKGDFNEIKNNLNNCIDNINALVTDTNLLVEAAVQGKLATRADASKHQGDYRKIVEGVNQTLDAVINPLNVSAEYVDRISKGDIPPKITDSYNGDFNEIKNNLNVLIDVANNLLKEADVLVTASNEGKLDTRGNADQFAGGWRELYKGINNILDAILIPIGEGNRVLAQISNGKIDELITQTYKGDHEAMKKNINNVALVLQGLQKELQRLTEASKEGCSPREANPNSSKAPMRK